VSHADSGRHAPEARTVQLPVAGQVLAQMNHFMRQARQQRGGVPIAGFADTDKRHALIHAEIGRQAGAAHDMKADLVGMCAGFDRLSCRDV